MNKNHNMFRFSLIINDHLLTDYNFACKFEFMCKIYSCHQYLLLNVLFISLELNNTFRITYLTQFTTLSKALLSSLSFYFEINIFLEDSSNLQGVWGFKSKPLRMRKFEIYLIILFAKINVSVVKIDFKIFSI